MRAASFTCSLLLLAGSACTATSSPDNLPTGRFERIDEVKGTYGGVGIGDSKEDVWLVFGEKAPLPHSEPFRPTGADDEDYLGPTFIPADRGYAYEDAIFWFPVENLHLGRGSPLRDKQDEVGGFVVAARQVRTLRGIQVGDSMDEARAAYPELACSDRPAGEFTTYPACTGRIAEERHIWFGGDPIATISVSRSPM